MKHKTGHILSFLLIIIMIIFTVATTIAPRRLYDRLGYEKHDKYSFILVETIRTPDSYQLNSFDIIFDESEEFQFFYKFENEEKFMIKLYGKGAKLIEEIITDELIFETLITEKYFIIKLNEEIIKFIKYDNWKVSRVYFRNCHEEYIF